MSDTVAKSIDKALGIYYYQQSRNDYFYDNGFGKFFSYCQNEGFDDEDIIEELSDGTAKDCGFLDFDNNFPFNTTNINDEESKYLEIFTVLQNCYKYGIANLNQFSYVYIYYPCTNISLITLITNTKY